MKWWKKPDDIEQRIAGMAPFRARVIDLARLYLDAEVTYEKRGKSVFWKFALEDGGAYTIYERRQDEITPLLLLHIAEGERLNCSGALRARVHVAIMDFIEGQMRKAA